MNRARLSAVFSLGLVAISGNVSAAPSLSWDGVFSSERVAPDLHIKARYSDKQTHEHVLELWRSGDAHLRRTTDKRIDIHVDKGDDGEYHYQIADLEKRILVQVDRTNLYRIGTFSDWPSLAHILIRPKGEYALTPITRHAGKIAGRTCKWYRLDQGEPREASEICWSRKLEIPLQIKRLDENRHSRLVWNVQQANIRPLPLADFEIRKEHLMEVDANSDIDPNRD